MAQSLELYSGSVSSGGTDGTLSASLTIGATPSMFAVRFFPGFCIRSNSMVRVWADGPEASLVQFASDVAGSPGLWSALGARLSLADVKDVNTLFWCKTVGTVSSATLIRASGSPERSSYVADFSGSAGAVADPAYFYPLTVANGTIALDGAGGLAMTTAATADGAILWRREALDFSRSWKISRKVQATTGGSNPAFTSAEVLHVNAASFPWPPNTDAWQNPSQRVMVKMTNVSNNLKFTITARYTDGSWRSWNSNGTWSATATQFAGGWNTEYWVDLEFAPATGFRTTVQNSDRTSTIVQTGWRSLADIQAFDKDWAWLYGGDSWTNFHTGRTVTSAWVEA